MTWSREESSRQVASTVCTAFTRAEGGVRGHCYTSVDVMCSADGGPWFVGGGTMVSVCAQPPVRQVTFNCEGGDYYEVDPAPGSFLYEAA